MTNKVLSPKVKQAVIAQVRFGERMALKYSNREIAKRFDIHHRTVSLILRQFRHSQGLPSGNDYKRHRGRRPKKGYVWSAALRA